MTGSNIWFCNLYLIESMKRINTSKQTHFTRVTCTDRQKQIYDKIMF